MFGRTPTVKEAKQALGGVEVSTTSDAGDKSGKAILPSDFVIKHRLMGLSDDEINSLQSGSTAAEGMPVQASNITPVSTSLEQLSNLFHELESRVKSLEQNLHNDLK